MDRAGRLKELQNALRYLYGQKVDENTAYDQLKDDPRFEGWIRLPKVKTIYKQLRTERVKSAKTSSSKPWVEEPPANVVDQIKKCVIPSFKATLQCDHAICPCLKNGYGVSVDARFIVYGYPLKTNDDFYGFLVHDVFSNKERYSKFQTLPDTEIGGFVLLNGDFGVDFDHDHEFFRVDLIELDWSNQEMRVVQKIRLPLEPPASFVCNPSESQFIYINYVQPASSFVQIYKFGNDEFVLEHSNFIEAWPNYCSNSFFAGKLYGFKYHNGFVTLPAPSIHVKDFEKNTPTSLFTLQWPSGNFHVVNSNGFMIHRWILGRYYIVIKFDGDDTFGIAWINCETLEWTPMNFRIIEPIIGIQFIAENGILLVQTVDGETGLGDSSVHQVNRTFYRIPLKKPDLLTNLAWSALVHSKSKLPGVDPYEESRKYLPFTSEIQCPFDE